MGHSVLVGGKKKKVYSGRVVVGDKVGEKTRVDLICSSSRRQREGGTERELAGDQLSVVGVLADVGL